MDPGKNVAYHGVAVWANVAAAIEKARKLAPGTIRFAASGTSYGWASPKGVVRRSRMAPIRQRTL